jgi:two-component system copper resistance phosphate regulon response regulator CusR
MNDVHNMTPDAGHPAVKGPNQKPTTATNDILRVDDLKMDLDAHIVTRGKVLIPLNRKEFALLELLMRNSGTLLTREMILQHVWDILRTDPLTNTVDVHVRFLRKKIDDGRRNKLIQTVHGYGYKMVGKIN